jgi:hypothetical protein
MFSSQYALQSSGSSSVLDKKQRVFERTIQEYTVKVRELQMEVAN